MKCADMKCFHPMCNRGLATGDGLFRVNAKGQPGIWACREHIKQTDATIPKEVDCVVRAFERTAQRT